MMKGIGVSVAVVLLLGAGAFAQADNAGNEQQLLIVSPHTMYSVLSIYGPGAVGTANLSLTITGLDQTTTANSGATAANQHITGSLSQVGSAETQGAGTMAMTLTLDVQTVGITNFIFPGQNQTMEADGDAQQSQGVQVAGSQILVKGAGGWALGTGSNEVTDLNLTQNVAGTGTTGTQSMVLTGVQETSLTGAANASGSVIANLGLVTAQNQQVSQ